MASIESVNVGMSMPSGVKGGFSGIDKHPVADPVRVAVPGFGRSGLAGDAILDTPHHGGPDQAVYAYAREDLRMWEARLGRELRGGFFGENLTTAGLDVNGAVIGETWQVGDEVVLQVTSPRTPCVTFQAQLQRPGWIREFTREALPGAYLRVLVPGEIRSGDPVTVLERPEAAVTVALVFRALHLDAELLPRLLAAPLLPEEIRELVSRRLAS